MINQKFHAIRASIISGQKGNEYLILSTKSACKKCSPSTFEKGVGKFDIITTFEPPERMPFPTHSPPLLKSLPKLIVGHKGK